MLTRFSVENFKNFEDKITWDLSNTNNYGFNTQLISNETITKGLIYGPNGSGKSNLGLALFDIILHLTDKEKLFDKYRIYLNLNSDKKFATFEYVFKFDESELIYQYKKENATTLLEERLFINGKEMIFFDFGKQQGFVLLEGAQNLNLISDSPISRVKYVRSNAILVDNEANQVFHKFMDFVERMLLFYSLDHRGYQGFCVGVEQVTKRIIEDHKTREFQEFLVENGIEYELIEDSFDEEKILLCDYKKGKANFLSIASTGTLSLSLFYYWYIRFQSASLVFIDEFDAFYHFEISTNIIKLLRGLKNQIFLTTHNTDLMSNDLLRPDCYFIISNNKIRSLSDSTSKELRMAHNLQKMYKAGAFDEE